MAAKYDQSRKSTRLYDWPNGQKMAVGATTAASAAIDAIEVMICASARCFVTAGATPEAADAADSIPLEVGEKLHIQIEPGWKVAAIRDVADGDLYLLPVDSSSAR